MTVGREYGRSIILLFITITTLCTLHEFLSNKLTLHMSTAYVLIPKKHSEDALRASCLTDVSQNTPVLYN